MSEIERILPNMLDNPVEDAIEESEFTPIGQEDWPPDEGEDIDLDPDMNFESEVKDEFPGGW